MRFISARLHGVLDYILIVAFALAPTVLHFTEAVMVLCYVLAVIHLCISLVTAYPLSLTKKFAFAYHGAVEFWVGIGLMLYGLIGLRNTARLFIVIIGLLIFLSFLCTDFNERNS